MLKNPDYAKQREGIKNVENEQEQLKDKGLADLETEKQEKIDDAKQSIRNKFTMGANDEAEMRAELSELMNTGNSNYDRMLQQADSERRSQDEIL